MPVIEIKETVPAPAEEVFDLLHDYERRLEWDTLLSEAYLEPAFDRAKTGAVSVCRGKMRLGGFALRARYVSFERGKVAAVKMLNRPPFFGTFAASIRHIPLSEQASEIVYKLNFTARPTALRFVFEPVMSRVLRWETQKRLRALRQHFES